MTIHPIEVESYRIMRSQVDFSAWPAATAAVVERMVHATADESFASSARIGAGAIAAIRRALAVDAPIIVDATMVAAGITRRTTRCFLEEVPVAPAGSTRSAEAIRVAARACPYGAVWVFGNAPTALFALLDLHVAGAVEPAAVVALPVGYVGATESKDALWASPLADRAVTNAGPRGGSAVAAAAMNAVIRMDERTQRC